MNKPTTRRRSAGCRTGQSVLILAGLFMWSGCATREPYLERENFAHHVRFFNAMEPERVVNRISNAESWEWMKEQIPFFECPDPVVEQIYYFRWWALRKHLKTVEDYSVYTEFIELDTKAPFIPPERTIASALGHHFMETRWLRNQADDDRYVDYWIEGNGGAPQFHFHKYSSWLMDALWERYLVTGDAGFLEQRFDFFLADYERWKDEKQREDGLYWQYDVWDAMEESISGSRQEKNIRPTLNSYMYGNARALARMARLSGREETARELEKEAEALRSKVQAVLWNPQQEFFEVVHEDGSFAEVREAIGFIPWYFNLPEPDREYAVAWKQLNDPEGFKAPYGLTTAERRHPDFRSHGTGTCEWDGAVWPFATSQTLGALANALRSDDAVPLCREDYMDAFLTYTQSQFYDGLPYIGEYLDDTTGEWLKGRDPRSFYYHHSTYADLLITDVLGFQPQEDGSIVVDPFLSADTWEWFCIDGIQYRGDTITIIWDKDGRRYGNGPGMRLLVDGAIVADRPSLGPLYYGGAE